MKKCFLFVALSLLVFASCGSKGDQGSKTVRPVKTAVVESNSEINKDFAGITEAVDFVKLAFRVSGQIIKLPVVEGQKVQKGQLIAEIDTRDIAPQYAADKASYETASAQLERNKRLLSKQAISTQEYEMSVASYQKAKSAYELSSNNMRDARLYAPFDGSIEEKMAENFQRTMAGIPVVKLVNTNKLRIKFVIPDAYLYLLRAKNLTYKVEFDNYKGKVFNAKLEEFLEVSADGAGLPVTITIDDPTFDKSVYIVKPGFTCNVRFSANIGTFLDESLMVVPLSAVFDEPTTGETSVWVLKSDNTVERRVVEVYSPSRDSKALISKGLKAGEVVVTAGVYQIVNGEKVNPIQ